MLILGIFSFMLSAIFAFENKDNANKPNQLHKKSLPSSIAPLPPKSKPLGSLLSGQAPFNYTIFSFSSLISWNLIIRLKYLKILCIFIIRETNLIFFLKISVSLKKYWNLKSILDESYESPDFVLAMVGYWIYWAC